MNARGQNLIEYTLMIGLVVLILLVAIKTTGIDTAISNIWSAVTSSLQTVRS